MNIQKKYRSIDLYVIAAANLFNLIMVVIFYLRTRDIDHPLVFAYVWAGLIIVFIIATILNLIAKLSWWAISFPLIFSVFLVIELILDYILQIEFRNTYLLTPYLILYYVSILGMIGYSFLTEKKFGAITLATYFLSQIAALYSYLNVGHG